MLFRIDFLTIKPIKAPGHAKQRLEMLIRDRKLEERYGKVAQHLDYVFEKDWCFICNREALDAIPTTALVGALNMSLGLSDMPYAVICTHITTPDKLTIKTRKITRKDGVETLAHAEILDIGGNFHALIYTHDSEVVRILRESVNKYITIGGWRKYGYGIALITSVVEIKNPNIENMLIRVISKKHINIKAKKPLEINGKVINPRK